MNDSSIQFCTLGMFIIDEIDYTGSRGRQECVIGGAGTYAAIGARLVAGVNHSASVGWIVDMGSDFPIKFRHMIESWSTSCQFREDKNRLTTRAWNGYGPEGHRAFKYLTPKIRLDQNSLSDRLLHARSFHFVCSAERCMDLIHGILGRLATHQSQKQNSGSRPLFVWEPIPDLCIPENVNSFRQAIQQVDIVSPNVEELSGFFTEKNKSKAHMAAEVLKWGIGPDGNGALVIREGKDGCSAFLRAHQTHLKAYHTPAQESQARVVDPTGGGNAFLGALAMAWTGSVRPLVDETRRLLASQASSTEPFDHLTICLIYATVAASFVIEQPGMPTHGTELDGRETWNGEHFEDRLRAYLSREEAFFTQQMRHSKKKKN